MTGTKKSSRVVKEGGKTLRSTKVVKEKEEKPKPSKAASKTKRKKAPVVVPPSSTSSSDTEDNYSSVKYSFSGEKTFKNIFDEVQSTMRGSSSTGITNEELFEMYKNDPIFQTTTSKSNKSSQSASSSSNGLFHSKSKSKTAVPSTSKSCKTSAAAPITLTVGFTLPEPSSSTARPRDMYPLDAPMTAEQIAVADIPTDTEIDVEEAPTKKSKKLKKTMPKNTGRGRFGRGKNAVIAEEISISSDEDAEDVNDSFRKFLAETSFQPDLSPVSGPSPLDISVVNGVDNDDIVVLDSPSPPVAVASPSMDYLLADLGQMKIRIKFQGETYKFHGNERWDVGRVRYELSVLTKVPENEILLYSPHDNCMKMEDGKTLLTYKIEGGDEIEAMRRSVERPTFSPANHHVDKITLKFQKAGLKKPLMLPVSKFSNFKDIRAILALELKTLDEKKLSFKFDGDIVDLVQTPDDLDMENNDCIDVFEKT